LFIEDRYFGDPELNGTPVTENHIDQCEYCTMCLLFLVM